MHVLSFGSTVVRRVCRSTVQAEAYILDLCVEEADLMRAAILDLRGLLNRRDWGDQRSLSDALGMAHRLQILE